MAKTDDFILLVDTSTESITSRLTTSGTRWVGKKFDSGTDNWKRIASQARSKHCVGVIATLREFTYRRIVEDAEGSVIGDVLSAFAAKPHLILVHEAVLGGAAIYEGKEDDGTPSWAVWENYDTEWTEALARSHFGDIDETIRITANTRLEGAGLTLTPYKRNAEASVLSVGFIDDLESNLLFRLYIPANRLYENEMADLYRLFHDWLTNVRGQKVRQSGYATAHGQVVEFFAENRGDASAIGAEVETFQHFLSLVDKPVEAADLLAGIGIDASRIDEIVSRYSKRARRLQVDLRQERERKALDIRHELESELTDLATTVSPEAVAALVDQLLPVGPGVLGNVALNGSSANAALTINQQIIGTVQGVVAQHIAGDVVQGIQPDELRALITEFGAQRQGELLEALQELSDSSAPKQGRIQARQKLKSFLLSLGGKVTQAALNLLQKWLEDQMGLS